MSIILDALNKAEKERTSTDEERPATRPPNFTSRVEGEGGAAPSKNKKSPPYFLLGVVVLALGGFFTLRFFHKSSPSLLPTPIPTASHLIKKSPDELRTQALASFNQGDFEKSSPLWNQLTLLTPTDEGVYNNLGVVLKKMGKKEEARDAYQKALSLNPNYPETLNNMGVLLMEDQSTDQAKELFNKSIGLKPEYAEPYFHLALIEESEGNKAQAIAHYSTFLKLEENIGADIQAKINDRIKTLQHP